VAAEYTFTIYNKVSGLPEQWDHLAKSNVFLATAYLSVLETSAPENMTCHYIGLFSANELIGVALSQFLDLSRFESFGDRDRCFKTSARNFLFKKFSSHVLFIGNNMLTGQNALALSESADAVTAFQTLEKATRQLKRFFEKQNKKVHLLILKDFDKPEMENFHKAGFNHFLEFSTQPNMILDIAHSWISFDHYISDLSKKYRDQYKRARKRADGMAKQKMGLEDIIRLEDEIYSLYRHVALNAPFNTFFLSKNHFRSLKEHLTDDFLFYGYFIDDKLLGFNTLIKNGDTLDTYFLGYDEAVQRDKMLYLNMLYDMITYAINRGFRKIVFARTALEIKSSVGAKPFKMYGLMQHSNQLINKKLDKVFDLLEPKAIWQQRHPFKVPMV
jgi:predicted N-acyltransferase